MIRDGSELRGTTIEQHPLSTSELTKTARRALRNVSIPSLNYRSLYTTAKSTLILLLSVAALFTLVYVGRMAVNSINFNRWQTNVNAPVPSSFTTARVVSNKDLNLRAGAGTQYQIIMIIPRNTQVVVLNESQYVKKDLWVKVRVSTQEGWVNKIYLR